MPNKYEGLAIKSAIEAADVVGKVEDSNYLAHTIREIELAMLKIWGVHYHIVTYEAATNNTAKIHFSDQCSTIRIPAARENTDMDDRRVRLTLAHELGHLVYNFDNLKNPEVLKSRSATTKEEAFAWEFAFHLINMKSEGHKSDIRRKRFVYEGDALKQSLVAILRNHDPAVRDAVAVAISL